MGIFDKKSKVKTETVLFVQKRLEMPALYSTYIEYLTDGEDHNKGDFEILHYEATDRKGQPYITVKYFANERRGMILFNDQFEFEVGELKVNKGEYALILCEPAITVHRFGAKKMNSKGMIRMISILNSINKTKLKASLFYDINNLEDEDAKPVEFTFVCIDPNSADDLFAEAINAKGEKFAYYKTENGIRAVNKVRAQADKAKAVAEAKAKIAEAEALVAKEQAEKEAARLAAEAEAKAKADAEAKAQAEKEARLAAEEKARADEAAKAYAAAQAAAEAEHGTKEAKAKAEAAAKAEAEARAAAEAAREAREKAEAEAEAARNAAKAEKAAALEAKAKAEKAAADAAAKAEKAAAQAAAKAEKAAAEAEKKAAQAAAEAKAQAAAEAKAAREKAEADIKAAEEAKAAAVAQAAAEAEAARAKAAADIKAAEEAKAAAEASAASAAERARKNLQKQQMKQMLMDGMPPKMVAKYTGFTEEEVQKVADAIALLGDL